MKGHRAAVSTSSCPERRSFPRTSIVASCSRTFRRSRTSSSRSAVVKAPAGPSPRSIFAYFTHPRSAISSTPSRSTVTVPPASGAFRSANRQTLLADVGPCGPERGQGLWPGCGEGVMRRETVGSEATGPNTAGSARSIPTSTGQSPPIATARATSSSLLPGSCSARAFLHGVNAADIAVSKPVLRTAKSVNPRHLVQAAHLTHRQKQRRTSVKTFADPVSDGVAQSVLNSRSRCETAGEPRGGNLQHAPRGELRKTGRAAPSPPERPKKTAGQSPFVAGSRIATHSTCDVTRNRSTQNMWKKIAGQRRADGETDTRSMCTTCAMGATCDL